MEIDAKLKSFGFTQEDLQYLSEAGYDKNIILQQLINLHKGLPALQLVDSARVDNNGIIQLSDQKQDYYLKLFEESQNKYKIYKFVPSSGAASRMFKDLSLFYKTGEINQEAKIFFQNIKKFAFYPEIQEHFKKLFGVFYDKYVKKLIDSDSDCTDFFYFFITRFILEPDGLNYSYYPKAFVKFHKYKDGNRTAFEEHFAETAYLFKGRKTMFLHFTVPDGLVNEFEKFGNQIIPKYESKTSAKYVVEYSIQDAKTNTLSIDEEGKPVRKEDGTLLFRPAGHGALLKNLNRIDADIVFIKNIDNVVPDKLKEQTCKYPKIMTGMLLELKDKIFKYIEELPSADEGKITQILEFMQKQLNIKFDYDFWSLDLARKREILFEKLNRPIRVCGMVKNQGEPGGGPFFVRNKDNTISLQIVELAQIDTSIPRNKKIVQSSTHFNPTLIVCWLTDYKGNKFDLTDYVDEQSYIITTKYKDGKPIKVIELPGLWNGSMADWNTVFVEVPLVTFNPVKTVNSLLKENHQIEE